MWQELKFLCNIKPLHVFCLCETYLCSNIFDSFIHADILERGHHIRIEGHENVRGRGHRALLEGHLGGEMIESGHRVRRDMCTSAGDTGQGE